MDLKLRIGPVLWFATALTTLTSCTVTSHYRVNAEQLALKTSRPFETTFILDQEPAGALGLDDAPVVAGAGEGFLYGALKATSGTCNMEPECLLLLPILLPTLGLIGGTWGALFADSEASVESSGTSFRQNLVQIGFPNYTPAALEQALRETAPSLELRTLTRNEPVATGDRALVDSDTTGAETPQRNFLQGRLAWMFDGRGIDPKLRLQLLMKVCIGNARSAEPLVAKVVSVLGPGRKFRDWGRLNAEQIRDETMEILDAAAQLINDIIIGYEDMDEVPQPVASTVVERKWSGSWHELKEPLIPSDVAHSTAYLPLCDLQALGGGD